MLWWYDSFSYSCFFFHSALFSFYLSVQCRLLLKVSSVKVLFSDMKQVSLGKKAYPMVNSLTLLGPVVGLGTLGKGWENVVLCAQCDVHGKEEDKKLEVGENIGKTIYFLHPITIHHYRHSCSNFPLLILLRETPRFLVNLKM